LNFEMHEPTPESIEPILNPAAASEKLEAAKPLTTAPQIASDRQVLEKLVFSNLQEAKVARRWNICLRLAWLVFAIAVFWVLRNDNAPANNPTSAHTATVEIKGEIASGTDSSAENIVLAMRSALEDSGSKALVLVINSPGGSPVQ
jgi:protease-4